MKNIIFIFILLSMGLFAADNQENFYLKDFKLDKYLGTWYEIIRKDMLFEKDLDFVTATYTLKPDGKIEVINKGVNLLKDKESEITGKVRRKYEDVENILEVSFFGPFYSDYIILDYDKKNYSWALVIGENSKYMWILSREPQMDEELTLKLLSIAEKNGVELNNLVYVKQKK